MQPPGRYGNYQMPFENRNGNTQVYTGKGQITIEMMNIYKESIFYV